MNESTIEKNVCDYAKHRGCYVRKFTAPSRRGVPDRIFITPHGRVFFIEFKRPGGQPSLLQEREAKQIMACGVPVFIIDSTQAGKDRVQEQIDLPNAPHHPAGGDAESNNTRPSGLGA